jgi:hypothetical protein
MGGFQFQLPTLVKKTVVPKEFNMQARQGIFWSPRQSEAPSSPSKKGSMLRAFSPDKKSNPSSPTKITASPTKPAKII